MAAFLWFQRGTENDLAQTLSDDLPPGISRVLSFRHLPRRVYVQAENRLQVQATFTQGRKITQIPQEERAAFVRWFDWTGKKLLPEGAWVRFRRGDLKGDLGIVVESSDANDFVTVAAVPRIPIVDSSIFNYIHI